MSDANRRIAVLLNQVNQSGSANTTTSCFPSPTSSNYVRAQLTSAPHKRSPDDVVIVCALRTPICKAKRGAFKDTHWTDLLTVALKGVVEKSGVPAKAIEDVQVGTVLAAGGGATEARMALFAAGYPSSACLATTNRQCSSGLQAFVNIAGAIKTGQIKVGVAAGVESMSQHGFANGLGKINEKILKHQEAADCLTPMGITSENVAESFNISRQIQDEFAANSQAKAAKAQKSGLFKEEIIPVHTIINTEEGEKQITVEEDDGIRPTTVAALAQLKTSFKKDGSTTAGNSSQVSDGAAAVLVMSRAEAESRGLPLLGKFISASVVGVPPNIMGVGPAYAIPSALEKAGLSVADIDIFEINEAFASQAYYCINKLGIPIAKVNPLGGAIAFGHPLGCTGARMIATLLHQLRRTKKRLGVVSMCIGTGMGMAAVFEAE